MNDRWNIGFTQKAGRGRLRGLGVAVPLETQIFSGEGSEFDALLAEHFVAHVNVTLGEQGLHLPVTSGKR